MKRQVALGENKAVSLVTYEEEEGKPVVTLGIMVHLPSRYDPATNKTYYKAIGIEVPINREQRNELIEMLGGTTPCPK